MVQCGNNPHQKRANAKDASLLTFSSVRPALPTLPNVTTVTSSIVTRGQKCQAGRRTCHKHTVVIGGQGWWAQQNCVVMVMQMRSRWWESNIVSSILWQTKEHREESVTKLEERILAHCLLLPYVMANNNFETKFAAVYADWDVGTLNNPKQQMSPYVMALMS